LENAVLQHHFPDGGFIPLLAARDTPSFLPLNKTDPGALRLS